MLVYSKDITGRQQLKTLRSMSDQQMSCMVIMNKWNSESQTGRRVTHMSA